MLQKSGDFSCGGLKFMTVCLKTAEDIKINEGAELRLNGGRPPPGRPNERGCIVL